MQSEEPVAGKDERFEYLGAVVLGAVPGAETEVLNGHLVPHEVVR